MSKLIISLKKPDYSQVVRPEVLAGEARTSLPERLAITAINREHIQTCRRTLHDVLDGIGPNQISEQHVLCSMIISDLTDDQKKRIADSVRERDLGNTADDFEVELID